MNSDMSEADAVRRQIAAVFEEDLHLEIPSADTDLFETGVLDSMAFVELLHGLEQRFGITVSLDDLDINHFRSVNKIAGFILHKESSQKLARTVTNA